MIDLPKEVWDWVMQHWQLVPTRFVDWEGFSAMVLLCTPIAATCQVIFGITGLDVNPENEADPRRRRRIFSARRYILLIVTSFVLALVAYDFKLTDQYLRMEISDLSGGLGLFFLTVGEVSGTSAIGVKILKPIVQIMWSMIPRSASRGVQSGDDREWVSDYF